MQFDRDVLFHGGRRKFSGFDYKSDCSRLYAHWATTDPVAAALYAREGGWVMPLRVRAGAPLLDASGGVRGRPLHHVGDRMEELQAACFMQWDGTLDCMDNDRIADGRVHPLGPDGTPSWESFVWEDIDCEDLHAVLTAMGYDVVACTEGASNIRGDLIDPRNPAPVGSVLQQAQAEIIRRMVSRMGHLDVVAFLTPDAADFSGLDPIPADAILRVVAQHQAPPESDLAVVVANALASGSDIVGKIQRAPAFF